MSKHQTIMQTLVAEYHPKFTASAKIRQLAVNNPKYFNIEFLVEECMAHVGGYSFVDAAHYDFSDFSDCKTASIREAPKKPGAGSHRGVIEGISSPGGGFKYGALRCVIYNPHKKNLKYYFLPRSAWTNMLTFHPTTNIAKICFSYHLPKDHIRKLAGYECSSFEELAKAK
jgi:hypothetical protein